MIITTSINLGDIFKIKCDEKEFIFQYVTNDKSCLNSCVICVFKEDISNTKDVLSILKDLNVNFYIHIDIKRGIKENLWKKIGNAAVFNKTEIYFKSPVGFDDPELSGTEWNVWKVNEKFQKVINLSETQKKYFYGDILRPELVISKVKTGSFGLKYPSLG